MRDCFLKGPTSPTTPMLSPKALHLRLHHQWPAFSHLLHKAEGTHEPLTLQLPQQDIQCNEGARPAHASTR